MTTLNLSQFCVRNEDGTIDLVATKFKFEATLLQYQADRETEATVIANAVNALFDQFKGARLNMPYVVSQSLRNLNCPPEIYKSMENKVKEYLHANAGDKETGALFGIGKGKLGGVTRHADYKETEIK